VGPRPTLAEMIVETGSSIRRERYKGRSSYARDRGLRRCTKSWRGSKPGVNGVPRAVIRSAAPESRNGQSERRKVKMMDRLLGGLSDPAF